MTKIALVSDTTADLTDYLVDELDVHLVDAFVHFDTESFVIGELSLDEFYRRMENVDEENFPRTSQPKANDILERYELLKADGYDAILSIHVAAELSGTINSAHVAKGMIDQIDIRIIDSLGISANLIAVLQFARQLIDSDLELDEIVPKLEDFAKSIESYVTIKSMENLVKGGRISKIRFRFGRFLNIKPILRLKHGKLSPHAKAWGIENARNKMYNIATEQYEASENLKYIIAHTRELEAAEELENRLTSDFPKATGHIIEIGIVVAVHAGKGATLLLVYPEP